MFKKPWEEMRKEEINEIKRKWCCNCKYAIRLSQIPWKYVENIICNYCGKEGHSRGCRPDECDKYKPRPRRRKE